MHTNNTSFPPKLVAEIVRCVEDAVGDDIRADIQQNDLQTKNSVPSRIWDLLNTNIIKTLDTMDCTIAKAHRGPWEMLVVFEKTTQCIFTFMREKRFSELQKRQRTRRRMHYIDMLTHQFNSKLISDQQQTTLYPHTFSDKDRLAELVTALLRDLEGDAEIVRHHVLVLFDTVGYHLTSIRAVMVTPTLDIAQNSEHDWSQYISANESTVIEKVVHPDAPENQPGHGLTLKPKALARQRNKPKQKEQELSREG